MRKDDSLKRAGNHYFSTGLGDGASRLCRVNMLYGLAKIHIAQEKLGLEPNATFVSTPDETVTRNKYRWKAGFGYGGKLVWGSGRERLIVLDTKPNACGMLVGGLEELPDIKQFIQRISSLRHAPDLYIEDTKVDWDFYRGNHFMDLFEVVNYSEEVYLPGYAFMIHGSASELKRENEKGLGLYVDESKVLQEISKTIKTRFGPLHILLDSDAEEYFRFYRYADNYAKEKRRRIANEIFDGYKEICNVTHQGLLNYNVHVLGCQSVKNQETSIFPIALRADLPAFLMKGIDNFEDGIIDALGFKERAEKLGVTKRLSDADILPHGGGYAFSDVLGVKDVMEIKGDRYFILDMKSGMGNKVCSEVRDLEFYYRGKRVVQKSIELGLAEKAARLTPHYALKI